MSEENVAIIRRGYEAFARGDLNAVLDQMSEDIITYRGEPLGDSFRGREGYLEATADWAEGFSEWSVTPEEFIDAGQHVIVRMTQEARGEQSGAPVRAALWFVHTLSGGKVVRLGMFASESEAFRAAGAER